MASKHLDLLAYAKKIRCDAINSVRKLFSKSMEHAWVEAFVNYYPSRGTVQHGNVTHPQAPADTWVPIDPSYKQHTFKAGLNLKDSVAFDAQGFVDAAKQGATVNEAQGWVQNLNQTNIKTKLDQYQASIKTKIDATNGGNATVGDVLGSQTIIKDDIPYFAGSLKNKITAIGERYSQLPESLRAQFRYGIFYDQY